MTRSVYVFDAYGTLFDVHAAVRRHAGSIGPAAQRLSEIWREKQLEYSWVLSLAGRYRDFWALTEEALDYALAASPGVDAGLRGDLLEAYRDLDVYPEVPKELAALKAAGARLAILSNGSPRMLERAVASARLDGIVDEVISVDEIRVYKPSPAVYDLIETHFRVFPDAVSFQSSNRWDVAGATAHGLRAVWINRVGRPDEYADLPPAAVLPSLAGLYALG